MAKVRNVGLISAKGTGKTSLVEAILFNEKITKRLGRVEDGNTVSDYDQEEIDRTMSLSPTICSFERKGDRVHIVDTAGYSDFFNETKLICRVVDNAIMLVSGAEGVKSQANKLWQALDEFNVPRMVFINDMDKELADADQAWNALSDTFSGAVFVPITIAAKKDKELAGVVDIVAMKFVSYTADGSGAMKTEDIPDDFAGLAETYREKLVEAVAEIDDSLMERYLEGEEISADEISKALYEGASSGGLVPVCSGSAAKNVGVQPLVDYFLGLSASPQQRGEVKGVNKDDEEVLLKPEAGEMFAATVIKTSVDQYAGKASIFKVLSGTVSLDDTILIAEKDRKFKVSALTTMCGKTQNPIKSAEAGDIACVVKIDELQTGDTLCDPSKPFSYSKLQLPEPVIALAISASERGGEDKLSKALNSIIEEDPMLKLKRDEQTKQLTVCGTGQVHLDSVVNRMKKRFQVDVQVSPPEIPYRETITKSVEYVEYTHKKQTGGAGQYARVFIDMEPMERDAGYEYVDKIFGGSIDQVFRPSVDKGIQAVMANGVIAGYPVTDIRVSLVDGKTHPVDSKDIAFQVAGREVFKKAFMQCAPILLEPIMNVEIEIPDECMGDVIGDINSRRGRVSTTEQGNNVTIIKASVPLAEMLRYAPDLDSMTSGRGTYTMELGRYEEVPKRVADEIIEKHKKQQAEEE